MFIEQRSDGKKYVVASFSGEKTKILGSESDINVDMMKKITEKLCEKVIKKSNFATMLYNPNQYKKVLYTVIYRTLVRKYNISTNDVSLYEKSRILDTYYNVDFFVGEENIITDFVVNSNQSEGSRLTVEEAQKIITKNIQNNRKDNQDMQEFLNTRSAWRFLFDGFSFNQRSIKKLYRILTQDLMMENRQPYPKGYKKHNNIAGNSTTTEVSNVEREMDRLLQRYQNAKKTSDPLQLAFDFYFRFERIHPFQDGNGRIGRLLLNKILIAQGYLPMVIFAENKRAHFQAFEKGMENPKKRYRFMMDQYEKSLQKIQ